MAKTDFEETLSLADIQELTVLSLGTLCRGVTHLQRSYELLKPLSVLSRLGIVSHWTSGSENASLTSVLAIALQFLCNDIIAHER